MSRQWIEPDRFYTVYETAALLNTSRDSVTSLIERGELKAVIYPQMRGKGRNVKRMVLGQDLINFIERRKAA
jgi:excisionase family DNA binding protein